MAPRETSPFNEAKLHSTPIRDLGLTIEGTRLEPILEEFIQQLEQAGIRKLRPRFYLSTEWGVPFDTIAIAIPFYLARPDLTELQVEQIGVVEGFNRTDILRYLRHEMGHVVNYAYRLYDEEDWVNLFGAITQPYLEEYRPAPFSRRYVRHLPGWYAQKHPDEDWAETFAVWMTQQIDWRTEYAEWPAALAKLEYCHRTLTGLADREPLVTAFERHEDVGDLQSTLEQYYRSISAGKIELPRGLDGALRAIFEDLGQPEDASSTAPRKPASALIRRIERDLMNNVFRWTGHFPEKTRPLIRFLAERADFLNQVYAEDRELPAVVGLTTLVTALAMNYVHRGNYLA
jgi:hypothetical protein